MELKAKIIGVEQAFGGIIVVIEQEKMKLPIAEEQFENTDEAIIAKKMARSFKMIGFNVDNMMRPCEERGFRTGFWMAVEEYEEIGKPTVGDLLVMVVKLEEK